MNGPRRGARLGVSFPSFFGALTGGRPASDSPQTDAHRTPGDGTLDWSALLAGMIDLPESALICMELGASDDAWADLRKTREFLIDGLGGS